MGFKTVLKTYFENSGDLVFAQEYTSKNSTLIAVELKVQVANGGGTTSIDCYSALSVSEVSLAAQKESAPDQTRQTRCGSAQRAENRYERRPEVGAE
jgi:hypothetical protein